MEIAYDGTAYKGWQAQKKQTNFSKQNEKQTVSKYLQKLIFFSSSQTLIPAAYHNLHPHIFKKLPSYKHLSPPPQFSASYAQSRFFKINLSNVHPRIPSSACFFIFSNSFLQLNNGNIPPKQYKASFFRQNLSNLYPVLPKFLMFFNSNTHSHRKNTHQTTEESPKTVQSTLEKILSTVLRENTQLYAAGRTDAGVHAKMQYAHFDSAKELKLEKIKYSLNALLKNELIIIKSIKKVDDAFHARFSCKMKEYNYQLLIGHTHDIFNKNKYWLIPKFNIEKANQCGKLLEGTHDFSSFRDSQCQAKSPMRSIESCIFIEQNNFIQMKIKAKSFLHHQIRIIMGTIFEIIAKNEPIEKITEILEQKTRQKAGITAPAKGLFLTKIEY